MMLIGRVKLKTLIFMTLSWEFLSESKDFECDEDQFSCAHGGPCIPLSWFCDGRNHCINGSDEHTKRNSSDAYCRTKHYNRFCSVPSSHTSRRHLICKQKLGCHDDQFPCQDGITCIDLEMFCDHRNDCPDNSDEVENLAPMGRMCNPLSRRNFEKKCPLPDKFVCKSVTNGTTRVTCNNGIEKCLCSDELYIDAECFRCLSSIDHVISISKVCDGTIDCPDLSDECLCRIKPQACHFMLWDETLRPSLTCASNGTMSRLPIDSICNGSVECTDGIDEQNCSRVAGYGTSSSGAHQRNVSKHKCDGETKYATRCDGNLECIIDIQEEECRCTIKPKFCSYFGSNDNYYDQYFRCKTKLESGVFSTHKHMNGYLLGYEVCDGKKNCAGMEDEDSCPNRFYCGKHPLPNIPMTKICNMVDDCEDGRDEVNCSYFYCKDGGNVKYLHRKKVCDGNHDCVKGSDECDESCIKSVFSTEKSMIKHKGISILAVTLGFIAFAGNFILTFMMIRRITKLFKQRKRDNKAAKLTAILVMNLSISDLLVGIYILFIFGKSVEVEGKYCLVDREWRSSLPCSMLGVFLVVGSEESVFTMILITAMRMRMVFWPHSNLFLKPVFAIIIGTWMLSFMLALVPLVTLFEDYFVDSIWFRNNTLFTTIEKKEVVNMTNWLSFYFKRANKSDRVGSWGELEELIKNIDPNLNVAQKFGFYSTHSVCLPTFLPNRETDTAWAYSLSIILLNFIAFFVISIGYGKMFKEATKPNSAIQCNSELKRKRAVQNKRMQRKLIRIVASDFFCWMPVSFMAFCQVGGINIPPDAYLPIGLIIIPINSALNPFLYSDLPDMIWEKLSPQRMWIYRRICLPIENMYRGFRGNSKSAVSTDGVADIDRKQFVEMQEIEKNREVVEQHPNENPDDDEEHKRIENAEHDDKILDQVKKDGSSEETKDMNEEMKDDAIEADEEKSADKVAEMVEVIVK